MVKSKTNKLKDRTTKYVINKNILLFLIYKYDPKIYAHPYKLIYTTKQYFNNIKLNTTTHKYHKILLVDMFYYTNNKYTLGTITKIKQIKRILNIGALNVR